MKDFGVAELHEKWMDRGTGSIRLERLEDLAESVKSLGNGIAQLFKQMERDRDWVQRKLNEMKKLDQRLQEVEAEGLKKAGAKK